MATYSYPLSASLRQVMQDYVADMTVDDPLFNVLPIIEQDEWNVVWDQEDNFVGLMQGRGLDGEPPRVKPIGSKQFSIEPGVYGEYIGITEREMTVRRQLGTFNKPISLTDIVMRRTQQLTTRRVQRMRWMGWTLLTTGTYTVAGASGATLHTDTFTLQTFSASVGWGTAATSTPLADFRAIPILARGHSVNLGAGATAFMNRTTWNNLAGNANANDLFGRRTNFGATLNNTADWNRIFAGQDLPQIELYDKGYFNDAGTFTLYIPNNKVVVVGMREVGGKVGNLVLARNANNPNMGPGAYNKVLDNGDRGVPRKVEVHQGANIAPVLWYPTSIVVMSV